ncbi:probable disease resistance protein At1g61310 [Hibiscus syriacus]|uniref:probable disease resistance protein At1g61310 n=1 Tax=Hibiscus syriacus TaxID=106335 RepID=UPI001923A549|nr:probable disease resistance protein At1g61310 [Hibiscus syriacus]
MDCLFAFVGSLAGKAVEYSVEPTARQLSYLFKPRSKFQNLRRKVQDLKDARERVQQSVEAANRKGEVIFENVQSWLEAVNEKISEDAAAQLQKDEEKAMKRCFAGFRADFKSSYQLSKKADKEAEAIAQLLIQKENFDGVSHLPAIEAIDTIRLVEEYEAFESRRGAFDEVMSALEDDRVSIIGMYGMGGVGKTTLVKEVAGKANQDSFLVKWYWLQ